MNLIHGLLIVFFIVYFWRHRGPGAAMAAGCGMLALTTVGLVIPFPLHFIMALWLGVILSNWNRP